MKPRKVRSKGDSTYVQEIFVLMLIDEIRDNRRNLDGVVSIMYFHRKDLYTSGMLVEGVR